MPFLTPQEVERLTGYRKPAKQIAWLIRHGVKHFVNAQGLPIVSSEVLNARPSARFELGAVR